MLLAAKHASPVLSTGNGCPHQDTIVRPRGAAEVVVLRKGGFHIPGNPASHRVVLMVVAAAAAAGLAVNAVWQIHRLGQADCTAQDAVCQWHTLLRLYRDVARDTWPVDKEAMRG